MLTFVPRDAVRLTSGGPMTEYLFNRPDIEHRSCPVCGIKAMPLAAIRR